MFIRNIVLGLVAIAGSAAFAQADLEELVESQPERVQSLFERLDLQQAGLEEVRDAVSLEDWASACEALVSYYREGNTAAWLRESSPLEPNPSVIAEADAVLDDTFTFYDQTDTVPRGGDGGLTWDYTGPVDDKEWAWALNRHQYLGTLVSAYRMTGDAKYAKRWNDLVHDWVLQNPYAEPNENPLVWRGLETFFRVRYWAQGFYALQNEPALTDSTRILLLSSVPGHARYLRNFHKDTSNWIAMELNGLATAGLAWPEFADADAWVDYSTDRMTKELTAQVYPDGSQMELTAHYHVTTLVNFEGFYNTMRAAGRELPQAFPETVEAMWNYLAYTLRPDGYGPLNNDSDRDHNRPRLIARAYTFDRPDWLYIATNGSVGNAPEGLPSRVFPWAGQLVMRSGWDTSAHWAFFDGGPMGIGHRHADKLHLSVAAYGRDILVDGGRYSYVGDELRRYFTGSMSHNVLLIDGKPQSNHLFKTDESLAQHFVTSDEHDLGYGKFDSGFNGVEGEAVHERVVYYKRGGYWIVIDRVTTDRPREVTALWHFHPDCTVIAEGQTVASTDATAGNVRIAPMQNIEWEVQLVEGREDPVQGWWSREYNHKAPATCAVYTTHIDKTTTFAWLIVPARGVPGEASLAANIEGDVVSCVAAFGAEEDAVRLTVGPEPKAEPFIAPIR